MALIAKNEGSFEQIPAGTYQAVCFNVFDLGYQNSEYQGVKKVSHRIMIGFEVDERLKTGQYSGERMQIYKEYTLSLTDKANLRKDLEGWRSKQFTQAELEGFDLEKVIHKNCLITIIHNEKGRAKINAIGALTKNTATIKAETDQGYVPAWIQKKMNEKVNPDGTPYGQTLDPDDFRNGPIDPNEPGF